MREIACDKCGGSGRVLVARPIEVDVERWRSRYGPQVAAG